MAKKPTGIPKLKGKQLRTAIGEIQRMPISKTARQALIEMFTEAATPDRRDPERTLGKESGLAVKASTQRLVNQQRSRVARVSKLVQSELDDEAWMDEMEASLNVSDEG